jgi:peptide/nickel transport system substrate-binding protein
MDRAPPAGAGAALVPSQRVIRREKQVRDTFTRAGQSTIGRRRLLGAGALGGAAGLLALACGRRSETDDGGPAAANVPLAGATPDPSALKKEPQRGGTLPQVIGGDPPNLDMHANSTYLVSFTMAPVYNNLIQFDPLKAEETPQSIIGDLAKSWEQSGDGLQYTFKLNEGVTYHDGKPFTSADVKASLERMKNPPRGVVSPRQDSLEGIDSIQTPDASTAVIKLSRPMPSLLPILAQGWMSIYNAQDITGGFDYKLRTNGTGPFVLKEYVRGNRLTYEANKNYFVKGQPYLDGMTAYIMPDAGARTSAFQAGNILFVGSQFTESDLASLAPVLKDKMVVQRQNGFGFLTINFGAGAPWRDERVRRAVSLAMNRQNAIELLDEGQGRIGGYMPANGGWALSQEEVQALPGYAPTNDRVIQEARQLLQAAGVRQGHETTILTRRGASYERLSLFIKDNLTAVGINAKPQVLEDASAYDALNTRNFDLAPWSHSIALDDPDGIFAEFYITGAPRNYSDLSSPEVDALFQRQSQTLNVQDRVKLVKEMQQKAMPLFGKVIITWGLRRWTWWNRVQGYVGHVGLYNNNRHAGTWLEKA